MDRQKKGLCKKKEEEGVPGTRLILGLKLADAVLEIVGSNKFGKGPGPAVQELDPGQIQNRTGPAAAVEN